jgi:hypothetical protein
MRNNLLLSLLLLSFAFASCDNDDNNPALPGNTTEAYIDASAKETWHYFSLATGQVVGSADESAENNALWAARTDWDIAVQRYKVRTNSGEFTTAGAQGGVYIFDATNTDANGNILVSTPFASIQHVPAGTEFAADKTVTAAGMGGTTTTTVLSTAVVVQMWRNANGVLIMPPDYRPAPVYIFRSADGKNYYKVQFTQYQNENKVAGHVKFDVAQIYK